MEHVVMTRTFCLFFFLLSLHVVGCCLCCSASIRCVCAPGPEPGLMVYASMRRHAAACTQKWAKGKREKRRGRKKEFTMFKMVNGSFVISNVLGLRTTWPCWSIPHVHINTPKIACSLEPMRQNASISEPNISNKACFVCLLLFVRSFGSSVVGPVCARSKCAITLRSHLVRFGLLCLACLSCWLKLVRLHAHRLLLWSRVSSIVLIIGIVSYGRIRLGATNPKTFSHADPKEWHVCRCTARMFYVKPRSRMRHDTRVALSRALHRQMLST